MRQIIFRTKNETLTNQQARLIIEHANTLFSLLKMTDDAETYLKYLPALQEAIDAW